MFTEIEIPLLIKVKVLSDFVTRLAGGYCPVSHYFPLLERILKLAGRASELRCIEEFIILFSKTRQGVAIAEAVCTAACETIATW